MEIVTISRCNGTSQSCETVVVCPLPVVREIVVVCPLPVVREIVVVRPVPIRQACANFSSLLGIKSKYSHVRPRTFVVPENSLQPDSRGEGESAHHPK